MVGEIPMVLPSSSAQKICSSSIQAMQGTHKSEQNDGIQRSPDLGAPRAHLQGCSVGAGKADVSCLLIITAHRYC